MSNLITAADRFNKHLSGFRSIQAECESLIASFHDPRTAGYVAEANAIRAKYAPKMAELKERAYSLTGCASLAELKLWAIDRGLELDYRRKSSWQTICSIAWNE